MSAFMRAGVTALIGAGALMASAPALASCQFLAPVGGNGQSNIVTKTISLGSPLALQPPELEHRFLR